MRARVPFAAAESLIASAASMKEAAYAALYPLTPGRLFRGANTVHTVLHRRAATRKVEGVEPLLVPSSSPSSSDAAKKK